MTMTDEEIDRDFNFVAPIFADEGRKAKSTSVDFDDSDAASADSMHSRPIPFPHPSARSATLSQNLRLQTAPALFATTRPTASSLEADLDRRMADLRAQLVYRKTHALSLFTPVASCSYPAGRVALGKHFVASRVASPEPKRTFSYHQPADNAPNIYYPSPFTCPFVTKPKSYKAQLRYESYKPGNSHRGRAYRRYIEAERLRESGGRQHFDY
ncbi:hypothetical protein BDZ89DRAFT_1160669 [Hymenopellis radicata]|nr:hypothetical protein BDZ89DRAFT_1160669 [Hymenopellis radicata]